MAEFILNQEIKTEKPTIEVTISPDNPLKPGRHRFRLIVTDDAGNISLPDEFVVIVADNENPTAVLRGPKSVATGSSFELDGANSFDAGGGQITTYVWTYLGRE
jgi:hypothetical protein